MTEEQKYMSLAIDQAKIAASLNEVPVGAVVVYNGKIISGGYNKREKLKNSLYHAEIEAINGACKYLNEWRLIDCHLYVTLEPCAMCAGAIINSRISKLIYGTSDPKAGSCGSIINLFDLPYNHKPEVIYGIMQKECAFVLKDFFSGLRK
ncbi:MAG: nucleoside deaminase [Oscillospiraceae bacterium]|jgi:tRNA(adenine34) deaminase|nr:nucleoside deaminase [Oscillospiraceae bacterium]